MGPTENSQSIEDAALIVNLRSRAGVAASEEANRVLQGLGVRIRTSIRVSGGRELVQAVQTVLDLGAKSIIVGGGDGTLSTVVDPLANRPDLTLGILPVGTGNEVARVLGIPLDLPGACGVVARGRVGTIDLGDADGNYFLHTAMIGYPALVNRQTPAWLKLKFGRAAYIFSILWAITKTRRFRVRVVAGDYRWEGRTVLVTVGNGRFHTPGRVLLPLEEAESSGLMVYTPRSSHWITLVKILIGLYVIRRPQPSALLLRKAQQVTIDAYPHQIVDLDGESGRRTPVSIRLARDALRVFVP